MTSFHVLLLETIDEEAHALLEPGARVTLAPSPDPADCIEAARRSPVHAIMTRGKGQVTGELLDACGTCRVVARCGVGLDNVDVAAATARGIPVLNLPGSNAQTIAEHAVMLMLAVSRSLVPWANAVPAGEWQTRHRYEGDELHGKTLGIVGLGAIGSRVALIATALGMRVRYTDPASRDTPYENLQLPDLLANSDVITLHCSLTGETRCLLDAPAIAGMKPGAILINTARGPLIDQQALARALLNGKLAGFGADVLDPEPPDPADPLLAMPNVVITPHVGSLTRSTYRQICVRSARNVLAVLAGEEPEPGCVFNASDL